MKSCPKQRDGIFFPWIRNSSDKMYQMIAGHCAIWIKHTNCVIRVSIQCILFRIKFVTHILLLYSIGYVIIKWLFPLDPRQIYVPSEATTAMLIGSSRFRSKARLPVLTYLHSNQASICRCSQPLSGFSARCLEDEQMLEAIRNTNPNSKFMYVVDTRPRVRIFEFFFFRFLPHFFDSQQFSSSQHFSSNNKNQFKIRI